MAPLCMWGNVVLFCTCVLNLSHFFIATTGISLHLAILSVWRECKTTTTLHVQVGPRPEIEPPSTVPTVPTIVGPAKDHVRIAVYTLPTV